MNLKNIIRLVQSILEPRSEIIFAYIFGSAVKSEEPKDIDIAIYLTSTEVVKSKPLYDFRLSNEIEAGVKKPVDVIIMNSAPDHMIYEISKGNLIINKDDDLRIDFITLSWKKYFDIVAKRQVWLEEEAE